MNRRHGSIRTEREEGGSDTRQKKLWLAGLLLVLVSVAAAAIALSGGSGTDEGGVWADGVLVDVEPDRLRLRLSERVDRREEIVFAVRPDNYRIRAILSHLEVHARDQLPTRIYYERDGDEYVALSVEDPP